MVMTPEAPLATQRSMLSTSPVVGNPLASPNDLGSVRVGILAARRIEQAALMGVVAARCTTSGSSPRSPGIDVALVREGAGVSTREARETLVERDPGVRILALCDTVEQIAASIAAGAHGAILMTSTPNQLIDAIRDVVAGKAVLQPEALALLVSGGPKRPSIDPLERAVLDELAAGSTDAVIGSRCNLTNAVVRDIVSTLLRKFGVRGRVEVVIAAHHLGLLG